MPVTATRKRGKPLTKPVTSMSDRVALSCPSGVPNVADQVRQMGLMVGDIIEGNDAGECTRLKILWVGESAVMFAQADQVDGVWSDPFECSNRTLSGRQWYLVWRPKEALGELALEVRCVGGVSASAQEIEARQAVEVARRGLVVAMERLGEVVGEPKDEPCRECEGTGEDQLEKLSGRQVSCGRCNGSGRQKRVFPLIVKAIEWSKSEVLESALFHRGTTWVSVRPCDEACKGQTYLGWLLGDMALGPAVRMLSGGVLEIGMGMRNPAIFVPDLGRVVFGCESWWSPIKSADDLRKITNQDIDNVWYVRVLKEVSATGSVTEPV